ncbi:MAG TPA: hypothetical protein ENI63_00345 [Candidatus Kaiserbacteria bacterium]|nr:hypothetical protein [Candidatus Kaiserbacteria bacterium]
MKSYVIYKNQIQGIKDVSETVKTVEKIAASSVHFLKKEVSNLNAYSAELNKVLNKLSVFYQKKNHSLLQRKGTGKKALIILTGDKGLVGGLWHEIISVFLKNIKQYQSVIVMGTKGKNYLKEENIQIIKSFTDISDIPQQENIKHITDYIFNEFKDGVFSQVDILYPKFISLAQQTPTIVPFLPFEFKDSNVDYQNGKNMMENKEGTHKESSVGFKSTKGVGTGDGLPIFEPSKQKIFDNLLQKYIGIFFNEIVMETKLSELSERTVTMEYAVTKTKEFIKRLTLNYTKQRRRIITQRQLESFTAHKMM